MRICLSCLVKRDREKITEAKTRRELEEYIHEFNCHSGKGATPFFLFPFFHLRVNE